MQKDGCYFSGTFQPPIKWCEKGKKFAVFIMSARYSIKMLVYILIHLIKNTRVAVFILHMCMLVLYHNKKLFRHTDFKVSLNVFHFHKEGDF